MKDRKIRLTSLGKVTKLEAEKDSDISRYRVSLIGSGTVDRSYGTFTIPPAVLKAEAHKFDDSYAYSHTSGKGQHVPIDQYQTKDKIGSYKDVEFRDDLVFATLEVLNTSHGSDTAKQLDYAVKNTGFQGFSAVFTSQNDVKKRSRFSEDYDVTLEKIDEVISVDLVDFPAFDTDVKQKLSVEFFDRNDVPINHEGVTMAQEVTAERFEALNDTVEKLSANVAQVLEGLAGGKEETATTQTDDSNKTTQETAEDAGGKEETAATAEKTEAETRLLAHLDRLEKERVATEASQHFNTMTSGDKFPAFIRNKLAEQFGDFSDTTKEDVDKFIKPIKESLASDEVAKFLSARPVVSTDVVDKAFTGLQSNIQKREIKLGKDKYAEEDMRTVLNQAFNFDGNKWDGRRMAEALKKGARMFPEHERLADEQGKTLTEYFAGTSVRTDAAVGSLLLGIMIDSIGPAFNEVTDLQMARKFARTIVNPDFNDRRWTHVGIWLPQEAVVEEEGEYQVMNVPDGTQTPTAPDKVGAIVHFSLEQVENQPADAMGGFVVSIAQAYARLEMQNIFSCVISPRPTTIGGTTAPNNLATPIQQVYPVETITKDVKSLTGRALYWNATAGSHQANYKTQDRTTNLDTPAEFFTNDRVLAGMTAMRKFNLMSSSGALSGVRGVKAWAVLCDWNDEEIMQEIVNSPYKINTDSTWNQVNRTLAEANGGGGVIPVRVHANLDEIRVDATSNYRSYYALVGNPMDQDFLGISYRYGMEPRFFADPSQTELFTRDRFRFRIDHFHKVFPINWRGFYLENVGWEQA